MMIFYLALVVGLIVAVAYVALAVEAFLRVRRGGPAEPPDPADGGEATDGRTFGWKAAGGVVASTLALILISATPKAWYLLPALAIGSSAAVVTAFILDRRKTAS